MSEYTFFQSTGLLYVPVMFSLERNHFLAYPDHEYMYLKRRPSHVQRPDLTTSRYLSFIQFQTILLIGKFRLKSF